MRCVATEAVVHKDPFTGRRGTFDHPKAKFHPTSHGGTKQLPVLTSSSLICLRRKYSFETSWSKTHRGDLFETSVSLLPKKKKSRTGLTTRPFPIDLTSRAFPCQSALTLKNRLLERQDKEPGRLCHRLTSCLPFF